MSMLAESPSMKHSLLCQHEISYVFVYIFLRSGKLYNYCQYGTFSIQDMNNSLLILALSKIIRCYNEKYYAIGSKYMTLYSSTILFGVLLTITTSITKSKYQQIRSTYSKWNRQTRGKTYYLIYQNIYFPFLSCYQHLFQDIHYPFLAISHRMYS